MGPHPPPSLPPEASYAVGPPYIAHIDDWRRIATQWWAMMPLVHSQFPYLLAEARRRERRERRGGAHIGGLIYI